MAKCSWDPHDINCKSSVLLLIDPEILEDDLPCLVTQSDVFQLLSAAHYWSTPPVLSRVAPYYWSKYAEHLQYDSIYLKRCV